MNVVVLVGRLTRDPEMKFTNGGKTIANMRIAVDRAGDRQDDGTIGAGFFNVTCWERQAELCEQFLHKGSQAAFSGALRYREWEKDGQKRNAVDLTAFQVQFLDPKGENGASSDRTKASADAPPVDDDIPF